MGEWGEGGGGGGGGGGNLGVTSPCNPKGKPFREKPNKKLQYTKKQLLIKKTPPLLHETPSYYHLEAVILDISPISFAKSSKIAKTVPTVNTKTV